MILTTLENSLRNFLFIALFFTMFFFWIKSFFFYSKKTINLEKFLLIICNLSFVALLFTRWISSNHFPLSNLYESLIFLSWSLITILFFLQIKTNEPFLGVLLTPIILFIVTFATLILPSDMQKSTILVPALQSNWLMMHVTTMIISYACLIFGSLLSFTFLVVKKVSKENLLIEDSINLNGTSVSNFSTELPISSSKIDIFLEKLDNLSYRIIGFGFPLLTIGILSGAVWANETWGSYWSWDPKETWAFITWLFYSIYLHSRMVNEKKGEKPAIIGSIGFVAIWVCYLGVNIFGKGLHSYGWFEL